MEQMKDTNTTDRQFWALMRAGLWQKMDGSLFNSPVDWKEVVSMAVTRKVADVVANAVSLLLSDALPPVDELYRLHLQVTVNEEENLYARRVLADVASLLLFDGIYPILVGGQAASLNFGSPEQRPCSNIEMYVNEEDRERAAAIINNIDYPHTSVSLYRLSGHFDSPIRSDRFRYWVRNCIADKFMRRQKVNNITVMLPSTRFGVVSVFERFVHSPRREGNGLPLFCDWVMFLHTRCREIDRATLKRDLKQLGLWRVWQMMGCVAVDLLGLPRDEFPFYSNRFTSKKERAADVLFSVEGTTYLSAFRKLIVAARLADWLSIEKVCQPWYGITLFVRNTPEERDIDIEVPSPFRFQKSLSS